MAAAAPHRSLIRSLRIREVLLLQGAPFMGVVFSAGRLYPGQIPALARFGLASVLLVAHMWSLNDWSDQPAGGSDNRWSRLLGLSLLCLLGSAALFAFLPWRCLLLAGVIALCGALYSAPTLHFKGVPLASTALHLAGGLLHFLLGYSLFRVPDRRALLIGAFFSLVFAAGHAVQEVEDWDEDRMRRIRTNAVAFGWKPVFLAAAAGFAAAYAYLAALAATGIVPRYLGVLSLFLLAAQMVWSRQILREGRSVETLERHRRRYRVLFALLGLGMAALLFRQAGRSDRAAAPPLPPTSFRIALVVPTRSD